MKHLIAIAIALFALATVSDAQAQSRRIAYYDSYGHPVYQVQTFVGYDSCRRPVYRWVTQASHTPARPTCGTSNYRSHGTSYNRSYTPTRSYGYSNQRSYTPAYTPSYSRSYAPAPRCGHSSGFGVSFRIGR